MKIVMACGEVVLLLLLLLLFTNIYSTTDIYVYIIILFRANEKLPKSPSAQSQNYGGI